MSIQLIRRPVIETKCKVCGKWFLAERSKVLRGVRTCCSKTCRGKSARLAQPLHQGRKPTHGGCVGGKVIRLYRIWDCMKRRCHSPKSIKYSTYGGRGIKMCDEWRRSFPEFRRWAEQSGYSDNLQCDRKNNDLGYSPDNCRWVTAEQNCANRRKSIIFPNGETTARVAKRLGMSPGAVRSRLRKMKLSPKQASQMAKLFGADCKYFWTKIGKWTED